MSTDTIHLSQARHNENAADFIVQNNTFNDWGVTAAFYAAVHYFEYWLYQKPEKHSETSVPMKNGKTMMSNHKWRERLIQHYFLGQTIPITSYKKLRKSSEMARYLVSTGGMTANTFFTQAHVKNLIDIELNDLKTSLAVPSV